VRKLAAGDVQWTLGESSPSSFFSRRQIAIQGSLTNHLTEEVLDDLVHQIVFKSYGSNPRSGRNGIYQSDMATCRSLAQTDFKIEIWIWIMSKLW
jgi:hypothetical protein